MQWIIDKYHKKSCQKGNTYNGPRRHKKYMNNTIRIFLLKVMKYKYVERASMYIMHNTKIMTTLLLHWGRKDPVFTSFCYTICPKYSYIVTFCNTVHQLLLIRYNVLVYWNKKRIISYYILVV